jgi:Xaa-Pro aminopeptidase
MKKDIDALMRKMKINALYAEGLSSTNATMYYLLNGVNIFGYYIKKRGERPYVIHSSIEREVAKQTGYRLINMSTLNARAIMEKYEDKIKAHAKIIDAVFNKLNVKGRVAFIGTGATGASFHQLRLLGRYNKKIKIHYNPDKDIIALARETKDKQEVDRIKQAGAAVIGAFNSMIKKVRAMKMHKNAISKPDKKKLRIGDLRSMLQNDLFRRGYVNSSGMIVAQGRDAGVPHNAGNDREVVIPGATIVFDIYPQELGGGYYFDFTRTLCFGFASKKVRDVYNLVKEAQDFVIDQITVGKRNIEIEKKLCKFFERSGHATLMTDHCVQNGYCHSLGHGLGLNVHESPHFGLLKTNKDRIRRGHVFTIEPGLYYPEKGFGIRLEDVVYVNSRGKVINLTKCSRNLVVKM